MSECGEGVRVVFKYGANRPLRAARKPRRTNLLAQGAVSGPRWAESRQARRYGKPSEGEAECLDVPQTPIDPGNSTENQELGILIPGVPVARAAPLSSFWWRYAQSEEKLIEESVALSTYLQGTLRLNPAPESRLRFVARQPRAERSAQPDLSDRTSATPGSQVAQHRDAVVVCSILGEMTIHRSDICFLASTTGKLPAVATEHTNILRFTSALYSCA